MVHRLDAATADALRKAVLVELEPELFALHETLCALKADMAPREMETGRTERGPPELKDAAL